MEFKVVRASVGEVEYHPGWEYVPESEGWEWEKFTAEGIYIFKTYPPEDEWHVSNIRVMAGAVRVSQMQVRLLALMSPREVKAWLSERVGGR